LYFFFFFGGKTDLMQRIFIKKLFLFSVGSDCHIKWFKTGLNNSLKDIQKSQMCNQVTLLSLWQKQVCSRWRVDSSWQEDNERQCSNCTRAFPWFSTHHNIWTFEVSESVLTMDAHRTDELRKNKLNVSVLTSYGMQMEICLIGLLLGINHGCITINPNQSVLQCNGNIPVHLLVQPKSLRLCHQLGRLCLPCFGILREYC
jgi:hypothetical protein